MTDAPAPRRSPLDADEVRTALGPAYPWPEPSLVASTGSTNADLLALAAGGAPEGTVVVAEQQLAGRGRLDRRWESPPSAGLTFSVLLRPAPPVERWGWLPLLAGVAVVRAVRTHGVDVGLKWPNDVVVAGPGALRKLGGILAEHAGDAVVLGVGLNVDLTADELPVPDATSLSLLGPTPRRAVLLGDVLHALHRLYRQWSQADGDARAAGVADDYRDDCRTLGAQVRATVPGGAVVVGTARDVDELGRLVVDGPDGPLLVGAGDVVHVRPDLP